MIKGHSIEMAENNAIPGQSVTQTIPAQAPTVSYFENLLDFQVIYTILYEVAYYRSSVTSYKIYK